MEFSDAHAQPFDGTPKINWENAEHGTTIGGVVKKYEESRNTPTPHAFPAEAKSIEYFSATKVLYNSAYVSFSPPAAD